MASKRDDKAPKVIMQFQVQGPSNHKKHTCEIFHETLSKRSLCYNASGNRFHSSAYGGRRNSCPLAVHSGLEVEMQKRGR